VGDLRHTLAAKVRAAASARVRQPARPPAVQPAAAQAPRMRESAVVAIGASTGGTEAVARVMAELPAEFPGTLITQHIPAGFSKAFSERLDRACRMQVKEAADGDELRPGRALVAPGGLHMLLRRAGSAYRVTVKDGPRVCYQRPSVDVLFASVAEQAAANAVGVLLTGMGADGAAGLLRMREKGAATMAQDEASCVVFGMPREAIRLGAAAQVVPLDRVAPAILRLVTV